MLTRDRPVWTTDAATGLTGGARLSLSPNRDARPEGATPDVIIVHNISLPPGEFDGPWIEDFFLNRLDPGRHPYFETISNLQVSAHLLVRRTGEVIQFVPFHERAWHAGVSCCEGRERVNDFSIGIELEGADDQPFEEAQYRALSGIVRGLMCAYPGITPARIYGHSDIAPGRKTDPGPRFDWARLRADLA